MIFFAKAKNGTEQIVSYLSQQVDFCTIWQNKET